MTRVTFVSYDDEPPLGGQGVELRGMRAALTARGHSVTTVAGRGAHALRYPRITGRAPLDFSIHVNRHPELVTHSRPDVVHALGGPGGVLLVRDLGAPLVYTANHTYRMAHGPRSLRRQILSPVEAMAYRRAARVLAISSATAAAVRQLDVQLIASRSCRQELTYPMARATTRFGEASLRRPVGAGEGGHGGHRGDARRDPSATGRDRCRGWLRKPERRRSRLR